MNYLEQLIEFQKKVWNIEYCTGTLMVGTIMVIAAIILSVAIIAHEKHLHPVQKGERVALLWLFSAFVTFNWPLVLAFGTTITIIVGLYYWVGWRGRMVRDHIRHVRSMRIPVARIEKDRR